ncbi:hypothetical protein [Methanosarcina horonobensis]|uniref:hypothetical protein n=1 Tax=Methanosarcina horonobensis TaxID=418008 RepID=UPI000AA7A5A2|nr:hypothetical protein [Methanosarcina horonobensis]
MFKTSKAASVIPVNPIIFLKKSNIVKFKSLNILYMFIGKTSNTFQDSSTKKKLLSTFSMTPSWDKKANIFQFGIQKGDLSLNFFSQISSGFPESQLTALYNNIEEKLELISSFFKEGFEKSEYYVWIVSGTLGYENAETELKKSLL